MSPLINWCACMKLPHIHITVQKFLCCSKFKNGSPWVNSSDVDASSTDVEGGSQADPTDSTGSVTEEASDVNQEAR
jgi:hypothetical protein